MVYIFQAVFSLTTAGAALPGVFRSQMDRIDINSVTGLEDGMGRACLRAMATAIISLLEAGHREDAEWAVGKLAALRTHDLSDEVLAELLPGISSAVVLGASTSAFEALYIEAASRPAGRRLLGMIKASVGSRFGEIPPGKRDRARWLLAQLADIKTPTDDEDEGNEEMPP